MVVSLLGRTESSGGGKVSGLALPRRVASEETVIKQPSGYVDGPGQSNRWCTP